MFWLQLHTRSCDSKLDLPSLQKDVPLSPNLFFSQSLHNSLSFTPLRSCWLSFRYNRNPFWQQSSSTSPAENRLFAFLLRRGIALQSRSLLAKYTRECSSRNLAALLLEAFLGPFSLPSFYGYLLPFIALAQGPIPQKTLRLLEASTARLQAVTAYSTELHSTTDFLQQLLETPSTI